jgi:predicted CXXCH cytochrome family protein
MHHLPHWTKNTVIFGGISVWGLLLVGCVLTDRTVVVPPQVSGATFVGSKQCSECHEGVTGQFHDTTHSHLIASGAKGQELGCESCHGPASRHVKSGGEDGTIINNATMCASCHQDVQSRFNMASHHPLGEGIVGCTSCHDAHGSKQATLTSTNTLCTSCHQEVRGPHVFEHAPSAENCTTCHNPHGSPVKKMLNTSEPMLCLQCHSLPNNRHGQTAANANGTPISAAALRQCSSCHSAIHGSSQDEHLRY